MASSSSRPRRPAIGLAAVLLLLLAGCGEGTEPAGSPAAVERLAAAFGGLSDVIVVTAIDRLPLRSAVLVDPDGERTAAYSLDVASSPVLEPAEGDLQGAPGAPRYVTTVDTMVATALIRLPDPTRYGKSWGQWRVELHLGDPGGERDVTLPAPAPRR